MKKSTITPLREKLSEVYDLRAALALLEWDEEVYMPPKGATARGQQRATVSALVHRLMTSPEMGRLLDSAEADAGLSENDKILVCETRYDFEKARKLPESFVQRFAEAQSQAYQSWTKAREESSFARFHPQLQTLVHLAREKAEHVGYSGSPYNALLEEFERGMTTEQLTPLFAELSQRQTALIKRVGASSNLEEESWLHQIWDENAQWALSLRVLGDMGYDFEAGRQDKAVHPFTTNFGIHDVRVTTRISATQLFSCLSSAMHEGGHALYEQGFREEDARSPLAEAPSLGLHESQSRLWENMIGRSAAFWAYGLPLLRQFFPGQLDGIPMGHVYRSINRVRPSLIRVEADECTYNLHIILRFEIEAALLDGSLNVTDIPHLWNAKMKQYLGLVPPNHSLGCLQDIHWSHGAFGYFPAYALGNLYAAQLFEQIRRDLPSLWKDVQEGNFIPLLGWLRTNIHRVGRRMTAPQLIESVTGRPPEAAPYLRYLEEKFV